MMTMADPQARYIPWSEESGDMTACGIPINYNASKEWADKKVVLFSVPGQWLVWDFEAGPDD